MPTLPASSNAVCLLAKPSVAYHEFAPYFASATSSRSPCGGVSQSWKSCTPADLQARSASWSSKTELKTLLSEPQEGRQSFMPSGADLGVKIGLFESCLKRPAEALAKPGLLTQQYAPQTAKALASGLRA